MVAMLGDAQKRLGLKQILSDNSETWTARGGDLGQADRRKALFWYYGVPGFSLIFVWQHVCLQNIGALLSGVAVFTGLLFGLLILMFNTGVTLRKDGHAITSAHDLRGVISDLRANVTYAAVVAMLLAMLLGLAAVTSSPETGAHWAWTPIVVYLFTHLGLLLLTILKRFRTAFNYITR